LCCSFREADGITGVELSTAEIERRTAELLVMTPAAEH
jgi:hypothetical protein